MLARGAIPFRLPDRSTAGMLAGLTQPRGYASGGASSGVATSSLNRYNPASPDPVGNNPMNMPAPTGQGTYPFGPEWNWYTMLAGTKPGQPVGERQNARRGGRIRMADGGSLLETAVNSLTAADPTGGNPILQPYTGDYSTYGEGPEWDFFANAPTNPVTPPPVTPPPGTPGPSTGPDLGPGWPGSGIGTSASGTGPAGGNGGGGKGQFGDGSQQAAADASGRNTAVNPSLKGSLGLGLAAMGPLGMVGALAKQGLSTLGVTTKGPFDVPGPTLTAAQQASIANALNGIPDSVPAVTKANILNNAIAAARAQAKATGQGDPTGGAVTGAAAQGRAAAGGPGGGVGAHDGGLGGSGPMGGNGGQGANAGYKRGGPTMHGLGWLSNGGRLHLAGGGSTNNAVLTSLVPIAAGLIGNIVSGPIGGAIASGAATAMTGGSLTDALSNVGATGGLDDTSGGGGIASLLKYFGNLVGQNGVDAQVPASMGSGIDPTAASAAASLAKLVSRVPAPSASAPATSTTGSAPPLYANRGSLPGTQMAAGGATTKLDTTGTSVPTESGPYQGLVDLLRALGISGGPGALGAGHSPSGPPGSFSHGGELDARGGTHVQGEGDGQSDDIPAKLSDGEFVFDAATTSALGNGSNKEGAARLEQMRKMIRQKAGYKNVHTIPPKQKSVAALLGAVTQGKAA